MSALKLAYKIVFRLDSAYNLDRVRDLEAQKQNEILKYVKFCLLSS